MPQWLPQSGRKRAPAAGSRVEPRVPGDLAHVAGIIEFGTESFCILRFGRLAASC